MNGILLPFVSACVCARTQARVCMCVRVSLEIFLAISVHIGVRWRVLTCYIEMADHVAGLHTAPSGKTPKEVQKVWVLL